VAKAICHAITERNLWDVDGEFDSKSGAFRAISLDLTTSIIGIVADTLDERQFSEQEFKSFLPNSVWRLVEVDARDTISGEQFSQHLFDFELHRSFSAYLLGEKAIKGTEAKVKEHLNRVNNVNKDILPFVKQDQKLLSNEFYLSFDVVHKSIYTL